MNCHYILEEIIGKRLNTKNQPEYLVKWKGRSSEENTWEKMYKLRRHKNIITQFEEKQKTKEKTVSSEKRKSKVNKSTIIRGEPIEPNHQRCMGQLDTFEIKKTSKDKKVELEDSKLNLSFKDNQKINSRFLVNNKAQLLNKSVRNKSYSSDSQYVPDQKQPLIDLQKTELPKLISESKPTAEVSIQTETNQGGASSFIKILFLALDQNSKFYFRTEERGVQQYRSRDYILQNHPYDLILFYQNRLNFQMD